MILKARPNGFTSYDFYFGFGFYPGSFGGTYEIKKRSTTFNKFDKTSKK
jgi:hypothetical protein